MRYRAGASALVARMKDLSRNGLRLRRHGAAATTTRHIRFAGADGNAYMDRSMVARTGADEAVGLPALAIPGASWQRWLSILLSAALLAATLVRLHQLGLAGIRAALPSAPLFWIALAGHYLALPVSEWVIFRSLWRLPTAGLAALLRKLVSNELLLGYSGELSFYAWARRRAELTASPFGAIKDVSILSALAGNVVTLAMLCAAWPFRAMLGLGHVPGSVAASLGLLLAGSAALLLAGRHIFSLAGADLRRILAIHVIRIVAMMLLSGVLWHAALPGEPLQLWLLLAALQLVVTRLPFVPNKDLVFATCAAALLGGQPHVAALLALVAALVTCAHVVVGGLLASADLLERGAEA